MKEFSKQEIKDIMRLFKDIGSDYVDSCIYSNKATKEKEFDQFYEFCQSWFKEYESRK